MNTIRKALLLLPLVLCLGAARGAEVVAYIEIKGTIGPATADYIARASGIAGSWRATCLVIQLDTPGGLLDSTQAIVRSLYESPVPVVVHVAPSGANAGSAGCFITLAAHVAAMAPNTTIGAAHPVAAGGAQPGETMEKKIVSFAVSYIESIAKKRGRNVEWARKAVAESAAITATEALEINVIDLMADDLPGLLAELEGWRVDDRVLATAGAEVRPIPMLARERVFQLLWRPEVMFILMLMAIYGILGELSNPGAIIPGVVGAIALILVLYMSAVLPVNIAGVALIVLAVLLFVAEAFTPSFGLLTAGGVTAFLIGSLMLFDRAAPGFHLSLKVILPATLATAAFFVFVVSAGLRAQRLPTRVGTSTLVGRSADALTDIGPEGGRVFVEGEDWAAVSATPIRKGEKATVVSIKGLLLTVKPANPENPS
jgi:membrane-bound serine protease (ClpP class)